MKRPCSSGSAITLDNMQAAFEIAQAAFETAGDTTSAALYTAIAATYSAQAAAATAGIVTAGLAPGFTALAVSNAALAAEASGDVTQAVVDAVWESAKLIALQTTVFQLGIKGYGGSGGAGGDGGAGSFGFGGGAGGLGGDAGDAVNISGALGGSGGDGGAGGSGGFGGGGGGGGNAGDPGDNGGSTDTPLSEGSPGSGGSAGFGAGIGSEGLGGVGGNGGSGFGGAIFIRPGGTLTITGNALFNSNSVRGGNGQEETDDIGSGEAGGAAGSNIFMMKGSTVNLDAGEGNIIQFDSDPYGSSIADDSTTSIDGSPIASGRGSEINVMSGRVIFNGTNLYSGKTNLEGGVLQAQDGEGIYFDSNITFGGGVLQSNGEFTRFVGTQSNRTNWIGDGGFAAIGGDLVVRLSNGQSLTWAANSFVPNGNRLTFGSSSSDSEVHFMNNINLNSGNRTITVEANNFIPETDEAPSVDANVNHTTIRGVISNGALTVNGNGYEGRLNLAAANTYGGGTTIHNGSLVLVKAYNPTTGRLLSTGNLNANGAMVVNEDGTLDFSETGNLTIGTLAGAGTVDMGTHILTLNQNGNTEFSGSLRDGGLFEDNDFSISNATNGASLVKRGTGTLTLSGDNTYTSGTDIQVGRVTLTGSLQSDEISVASGAILDNVNSGLTSEAILTNRGTVNQGLDQTIAGYVSEQGGVLNGTSTLTAESYDLRGGSIVNANLGTGEVVANDLITLAGTSDASEFLIQSGTTQLSSAERLNDSMEVTIDSPAELVLGGSEKIGSLFGDGNLINSGHRLTLDSGSFAGDIEGSGGLTKVSDGTFEVLSALTYSGSTLINEGTLELSGNGSLVSDSVTISAGAKLDNLNGGLSSQATVTNNGTLNIAGVNDTIGILNSNNADVNGTGTLTASAYNLTGGTVINANLGTGTINVSSGATSLYGMSAAEIVNIAANSTLSLGASEILWDFAAVNVDGTLNLLAGDETIGTLNGAIGGVINTGEYQLIIRNGGSFLGSITTTKLNTTGGSLSINNGGDVITDNIDLSGGSNLVIGNGSTVINNENVVVNGGSTLSLDNGGSLTTANAINVAANGVLNLGTNGYNLEYDSLTGSGLVETNGNAFVNSIGAAIRGSLTFSHDLVNYGILAPGLSPGVITVMGNYTEAGTLDAEAENTTAITGHDQVRVGGTVLIDPASADLIFRTFNGSEPIQGNVYQLISDLAGNAKFVGGAFRDVTFDADGISGVATPVANAAVVFDLDNGQIVATGLNKADSNFADLGNTGNRRAAAEAIFRVAQEQGGGMNQIRSARAGGEDGGFFARQVIDSTSTPISDLAKYSPDYYGSLADFAFAGERAISQMVRRQISVTTPDLSANNPKGAFAGMIATETDGADSSDISRQDYFAGADIAAYEGFQVGFTVSKSVGKINANLADSDVDGIGGSLYAHVALPADLRLFGSLGFSGYDHDLRRSTVNGVVTAGTDVNSSTSTLGVMRSGLKVGSVAITPYASVTYSHASVDGFSETGAIDALENGGYDSSFLTGELGSAATWSTKVAGRNLNIELSIGLEQVVLDDNDRMDVAVISESDIAYSLHFEDEANTRLTYGLNLSYELSDSVNVFTGWNGHASSETFNNYNLGLRVGF